MTFVNYFHYLQIKEVVFDGTEVDDILANLKKCQNGTGKIYLDLETQLLHKMLAFSKNDYSVRIVMDTIRELQKQTNPDYIILMERNRELKIQHFEKLVHFLKLGDYPLARKQMRILINQLTLSIILNLSE